MSKSELISDILQSIFGFCETCYSLSNEDKMTIYTILDEEREVDLKDIIYMLQLIDSSLDSAPKNVIEFKNEY